MKPSHLTTPRTLGECQFQTGYYSVQPQQPYSYPDRVVMWASAIAAVATIVIVLFFPEVK